MKATITNASGETTVYKLDKFPFPKKGTQPEGYHLLDQDGNQLLSRITRSPWGVYTYVMYNAVSYSFPRHVLIPSGTKVEFSDGMMKTSPTKTASALDSKTITDMVEDLVQTRKAQEAAEAVESYYQDQLETPKDPIEEATKWVNEQETKRGLGQSPTIAEYLPKVQPKNKSPRRAPTK